MLPRDRPYKPLDVGNGVVAVSVDPTGRLLAVGGYHPGCGYVTLEGAAPFPDDRRHDPAAVRRYRRDLARDDAPGFGLRPAGGTWQVEAVQLQAGAIPVARLRHGDMRATVATWAPAGQHGMVQRWRLAATGPTGGEWPCTWTGPAHLGRASVTQLTEGGAPPLSRGGQRIQWRDGVLVVEAAGAGAAALAGLPGPPAGADLAHDRLTIPATVALPAAGGERTVALAVALGADAAQAVRRSKGLLARADRAGLAEATAGWEGLLGPGSPCAAPPLAGLLRRALVYVVGCCALAVDDDVCLLTDHRVLPLSWTRDGYWLCQALLADRSGRHLDLVAGYLRWLFHRARRPDGWWARSYLPNGQVKDAAFQLDQQCYPLLLLADYLAQGGDPDHLADCQRAVPAVVAALDRLAGPAGLVATDETPGDDPVPLPYHFSSNLLWWHTLRRLAGTSGPAAAPELDGGDLRAGAARLGAAVRRRFPHGEPPRFAYAVDARDGAVHYHDANDLPTVVAPVWGFCTADDPVWRATMAAAFSPANPRGWFPGRYGGLGSVHTPAPWPLGDVQELVYARLTDDRARAAAVVARLSQTACWDGALPEARDPDTGAVVSRHWFGWPGAALVAALDLLERC